MKQEYDFSKAVRGKFFREGAELQIPICSDRGSTHQRPNLFDYATKELSQDAIICWLVACAAESTGDLQKCGLEFVRTLFRAGASVLGPKGELTDPHDGPCDVSDVGCPRPQYDRIDVYFQAKVDENRVSFVIEDKKDGSTDSKQLARHIKVAIKDEEDEDLIKPIYFKTGYVFSDERKAVEQNNYSMFKAEDMAKFLDCQAVTQENEILRQYAEYLACQMKTRDDAQANWDLNQAHVQWEFMLKLRGRLGTAADEWQPFVPDELSGPPPNSDWLWRRVGRGGSRGRPWTQYWFARHLFWRLDSGRMFCVENPLRLIIDLKNAGINGAGINEAEINEMVGRYQEGFREVREQEGLEGTVPGRGGVPRTWGNQRTVGSIKATSFQGMTVSEFLNRVKRVHIRFLESIG